MFNHSLIGLVLAFAIVFACVNWREMYAGVVAAFRTVRKHGVDVFKVRSVTNVTIALSALLLIALGLMPAAAGASVIFVGDTNRVDIATMIAAEVTTTFKDVYLEALDAVPDATPLTAQMAKTTKVEGAAGNLVFNVKLRTGGAVANVGDGQKLPRASRGLRSKGTAGLAHTYTVIAVGGQTVPLTKKTRNAFVSNLEEQLEDGMERVKFDLERQYNGDGKGILCTLETVVGAPTYGAQSPFGYTYTQGGVQGIQLLVEDMDVAFINPGTGVERGRNKITSIDYVNDTFTLAAAVAGAVIGDHVVLCNDNSIAPGTADASINYLSEASGIGAVIGSAGDTFENILSTTSRRWQPIDVDQAGASVTEKVWATLDARIAARSGQKPELYYTTRGIVLGIQSDLAARRQYTGETIDLKGGYDGLKMNNRVVLPGDWCPKGHLYALNTAKKNVAMVDVVKMGYVDLDGSKLHRIEGRHSFRADLWFPHNALWYLRAAQGRLKNCLDDMTILR